MTLRRPGTPRGITEMTLRRPGTPRGITEMAPRGVIFNLPISGMAARTSRAGFFITEMAPRGVVFNFSISGMAARLDRNRSPIPEVTFRLSDSLDVTSENRELKMGAPSRFSENRNVWVITRRFSPENRELKMGTRHGSH